ncbi:MAG: hypothetical protein D6743_17295 [Calditrichaeota bacterium]|nr:MAG: hypothetical protein D6743_17295 [Calditrichota bacterium]
MKKVFSLFLGLTLLSFLAACGGGGGKNEPKARAQAPEQARAAAPGAYETITVTDGGTIKGQVTFAGAIPQKQKLEVTKDVNVCGKITHYKEDLVVSQNHGLANVVVHITNISKGKGLDALGESFVLNQHNCAFEPHVLLVAAGAECTILNSDGILHNIHTYSQKNPPINLAQPGFRKKMVQTFDEPEIFRIACDVHNWMGGYIAVAGNPYYAVTDANGNFELTDVPAGTYTLEYWQETLGTKTAEVTVPAGGVVEANMEFVPGSASKDEADQLASNN